MADVEIPETARVTAIRQAARFFFFVFIETTFFVVQPNLMVRST